MAGSELARRVAVAVVGIPIVVVAILTGGWLLGVLLASVAVITTGELFGLAAARGERPFAATGMVASGAIVLLATANPTPNQAAAPVLGVLVALVLVTLVGSVWLRWPGGEPLPAVAITLLGPVYVGCTLAFAVFLRHLPASVAGGGLGPARDVGWAASGFVLLPLVATWAGDSAAYFTGRTWGRRKLFPTASPGKTVAGGVGGLFGAALGGGLVAAFLLTGPSAPMISVPMGVWIGALLGVATPLGDVAESVLKREAGVKDSGRLLPGHGGFLDRVDSLLFAFPVTYGLLVLLGVLS